MPTDPPPVPVPPGGSLPGGAGATDPYYGLPMDYSTGSPLAAVDFDKLVALACNSLGGALSAIGAGTVLGGAAGTPTGLSLSVTEWMGILPSASSRLGFATGYAQAATLTIPANSSFVVFAAPVSGTFSDADATPYDTAESGQAEFLVVVDGSTPDGGLELLSGTASARTISGLTDQRVLIGAAVQTQIAAILTRLSADEAAIGSVYFGSTPPASSVATRVSALEAAAAGGPTPIVVFWDLLARSLSDPTTLPVYIASQIGPTQPAPTPPPLVTDVECVNTLKSVGISADLGVKLVAGGLMTNADLITSLNTAVNVFFYDPRIHGLDPTRIDTVHTTAPINLTTGEIG
ncbi:MAG: hypothetical protein ACRYFS_03580 [Janthinobacterium lividum]